MMLRLNHISHRKYQRQIWRVFNKGTVYKGIARYREATRYSLVPRLIKEDYKLSSEEFSDLVSTGLAPSCSPSFLLCPANGASYGENPTKCQRTQKPEGGKWIWRTKRHFAHVLSTYAPTSFCCCILNFACTKYLLLPPLCTHLSFHLFHETLLISLLMKLTNQDTPYGECVICVFPFFHM